MERKLLHFNLTQAIEITHCVSPSFKHKSTPGKHSVAVKQAAVVGLYCRAESAEALAKKVGVSRPTLYTWKNQLLGEEAPATMRRNKNVALDPEIAELERQREALQRKRVL